VLTESAAPRRGPPRRLATCCEAERTVTTFDFLLPASDGARLVLLDAQQLTQRG